MISQGNGWYLQFGAGVDVNTIMDQDLCQKPWVFLGNGKYYMLWYAAFVFVIEVLARNVSVSISQATDFMWLLYHRKLFLTMAYDL